MRRIKFDYEVPAALLTHTVHVAHSDYPAVKRGVMDVKAIWDTGADRTSVDINIIRKLGLRQLPKPPIVVKTGNGNSPKWHRFTRIP